MTELVWLDRERREAWHQMAIDLAMVAVATAGTAVLRLYRWQEDTLSLGANEAARRTWDRAALERDGVPCVRRPSGGRGVWHGSGDLTYAWAGPSGGPAGVRQRYRDLHDRLGAVIARRGLVTALAAAPARLPGLTPGGCFDLAIGGEVLVAGRKTIGSAQKVIGSELLQHGAIALGHHDGGAAYRLDGADAAQSSQQESLPDADELAGAITEQWHADGAVPAPAALVERILAASAAHRALFSDPAWTWRR